MGKRIPARYGRYVYGREGNSLDGVAKVRKGTGEHVVSRNGMDGAMLSGCVRARESRFDACPWSARARAHQRQHHLKRCYTSCRLPLSNVLLHACRITSTLWMLTDKTYVLHSITSG